MGKTIGLAQLAKKVYCLIEGLPEEITNSIGFPEDTFDAIFYGGSGNGKTNCSTKFIKEFIKAMNCQCEYIAFEEAHGRTIQKVFIEDHNLLEELGNVIKITDHLTFEELQTRMRRKQSAKIWVIDSLQASAFNAKQCAELKEEFVNGKKRKIIIYISWAEGKEPAGSCGKSVKYYANIKMHVDRFIMFPTSRYGGNRPYCIWEGNALKGLGAKGKWGEKEFWKIMGGKPKVVKGGKEAIGKEDKPKNKANILPPETEEEKAEAMLKKLKEG